MDDVQWILAGLGLAVFGGLALSVWAARHARIEDRRRRP